MIEHKTKNRHIFWCTSFAWNRPRPLSLLPRCSPLVLFLFFTLTDSYCRDFSFKETWCCSHERIQGDPSAQSLIGNTSWADKGCDTMESFVRNHHFFFFLPFFFMRLLSRSWQLAQQKNMSRSFHSVLKQLYKILEKKEKRSEYCVFSGEGSR